MDKEAVVATAKSEFPNGVAALSLSLGRGLGWVAGIDMGNTPGIDIGNTWRIFSTIH
jgi:hypothetical protein